MLLAALLAHRVRFVEHQRQDPIKSSGVLRVGTEGVYAPFSFHDPTAGRTRRLRRRRREGGRRQARREGRIRRDAVGLDLRGAGGQPVRHRRQRGHDQRRAQGRSTTSPSRTRSARASSSPARTTTRSSRWPTSRARSPPRPPPATGPQVARDAGAEVESVEGFAQAITLLNQGRVDAVVNDSIAVLRLPRRDRRQVGQDRRERSTRRASRPSPPARTAGCCPT